MAELDAAAAPNVKARLEVLTAVLLSIATVLTAWTAFEAAKWGGVQTRRFNTAATIRAEANRSSTAAGQQAVVDASVFASWLTASESGDEAVAELLADRFRDEFKVAFDDWLAMDPLTTESAPRTPFAMPSYVLAAAQRAATLDAEASAEFERATQANQRSDNYVFMAVLAAIVLALSAIASRFASTRVETVLLLGAAVTLFVALVITATFPVEI